MFKADIIFAVDNQNRSENKNNGAPRYCFPSMKKNNIERRLFAAP